MKTEELTQKIRDLNKEFKASAQKIFQESMADLFEAEPLLESINFKGWIPEWMDGEECVFETDIDYCQINNLDEDDCNLRRGEGEIKNVEDYEAMRDRVISFLNEFDEDMLQLVFGSNFELTITKDSIKVDEYDCGY